MILPSRSWMKESYGICLDCGRPSTRKSLARSPTPCGVSLANRRKKRRKSESPAVPWKKRRCFHPFGRTFFDGEDQAAYDGEDAWQDVARYGTANSPQDVPGPSILATRGSTRMRDRMSPSGLGHASGE